MLSTNLIAAEISWIRRKLNTLKMVAESLPGSTTCKSTSGWEISHQALKGLNALFSVNVYSRLKSYPSLLQTVSLCVPFQHFKDFSCSMLVSHATHITVLLMLPFQKENSPCDGLCEHYLQGILFCAYCVTD